MAGVIAAWFIGVTTNAYWVTLPLSLILGAVVVLTTGGRLADADHELAAAEADDRFALADAISRHPAGGAR